MCDYICQSRSYTWCQIRLLKTSTHDLKNTPKGVDDLEHSEDVGAFEEEIQEAATSGQLHSVTPCRIRVAKTPLVHEQKGQGFGGAPPVSQRRSGAENPKGMNRDGSLRSPLCNYHVLESETLTECGHSLGEGRRNIKEAEQDKEMWELRRK